MVNFETLPTELIQLILTYLPIKDRIKSASTSKFFNDAVNDKVFWKTLLIEIAGSHYQKPENESRSDKEICVETLKNLPTCAKNFIGIITWTEAKEKALDD